MSDADSILTRIRQALVQTVADGVDLELSTSWYPDDDLSTPSLHCLNGPVDYGLAFQKSGSDVTVEFTLEANITGGDTESVARTADMLIGWDTRSSVFMALRRDPTLGGLVGSVVVRSAEREQLNEGRVTWRVEVTLKQKGR